MKSCPVCSRTFEDTLTFCLIDGSVLSAPFDAQATVPSLEAPQTNPQATELLTQVRAAPHAGFQPPSSGYNQFVQPPAVTPPKPLTPLQIFGMWAQLALAVIASFFLSLLAAGIAIAIYLNLFRGRDDATGFSVIIITFLLTFAILMIFTFRWWRRKRRRAGLL